METEKKQDRRVIRTRRAIRNSFVALLAEKDLEKITIKEIADNADVDRKTVYNYYSGVYEMLDEIENELVSSFRTATESFEYGTTETHEIFAGVARLVRDNFELYALLMKGDGNSRLVSKLVVCLQETIRSVLGRNDFVPPLKIDLAAEFVTSGMFSAYRYWFNSDRKQTLEEFTDDVARLVMGGLPQYFLDL